MQTDEIANKIKEKGGSLYLVGGAVRNKFLNLEIHDEDYCVCGLTEEEFIKLFPNAKPRGKAFKVFDLDGKEFALARKDVKKGLGHKDFEIQSNPKITIEEDLYRRDITINSIAQDVLTKEIIDPFNGLKDIQNKIIRATSLSFKDDPLRVYRVARFASQLEFNVDVETIKLMKSMKSELSTLSKERVFEELKKALATDKPSIFFEVLRKADVLDAHFKEINDLIGVLQPEKYHPEGDAYNHTMLVLDYVSQNAKDLSIRFSALVHDLGKGLTPKEEYPHHYGHEDKGVTLAQTLGNRIGAKNEWIKAGKVACREHMRGGIFYKMKPSTKVDFIERVSKTKLGLDGLQLIVNADKLSGGRTPQGNFNFVDIGKKCLEEVNGDFIKQKYNIKEGIEFYKILRQERIEWIKQLHFDM